MAKFSEAEIAKAGEIINHILETRGLHEYTPVCTVQLALGDLYYEAAMEREEDNHNVAQLNLFDLPFETEYTLHNDPFADEIEEIILAAANSSVKF